MKAKKQAPPRHLYAAIWRWHFYAGLIAIPFMILLAVTGSLYLFKDEINTAFFAHRTHVAAANTAPLRPSALIAKAEASAPASHAMIFTSPVSDSASASVVLVTPHGKQRVWLNPYSGQVLDSVPRDMEFSTVVKHIHSLDYFGAYANRVIEIIAGFALVLVVTGFYLWWPRGQSGGVTRVRGTPQRRVFWRDMHAISGMIAGALVFFLSISGMPWSGWWGKEVHEIADQAGIGYPAGMWSGVPASDAHAHHTLDKTGWTLATSPMPKSAMIHGQPIGIDKAFEVAKARGIAHGFQLTLPQDRTGVYTASVFPDRLGEQRLIHFDQYSGKTLVDVSFADYGAVAQAIEFGINVHMGQEWGLINQLVMLATCLAIIFSSITACVMWWKRRPEGRLGVPPQPANKRVYFVLWGVMLAFGLLYPLTGLAIVAMLVFDLALVRNVPILRKAFS